MVVEDSRLKKRQKNTKRVSNSNYKELYQPEYNNPCNLGKISQYSFPFCKEKILLVQPSKKISCHLFWYNWGGEGGPKLFSQTQPLTTSNQCTRTLLHSTFFFSLSLIFCTTSFFLSLLRFEQWLLLNIFLFLLLCSNFARELMATEEKSHLLRRKIIARRKLIHKLELVKRIHL